MKYEIHRIRRMCAAHYKIFSVDIRTLYTLCVIFFLNLVTCVYVDAANTREHGV